MSSTITQPNYTRYIRQGRTLNPVAVTAMPACTAQAYLALVEADWTRTDPLSPSMPRHNWAQSGLSNNFDASKYCGDYADGSQHGYATAVCYTLRLPPDALTGAACDLESVAATLHGDRWLADGTILAAIPSSSATPPTWAAVLAAANATAAVMAVTPANDGTDSTYAATIEFESLSAPEYLHLVLRLADYATHRGAWIEGSALLDPTSLAITFSRAVAADAAPAPVPASTVPLRLLEATRYDFDALPANLDDTALSLDWAAKMLNGGQLAASLYTDGAPEDAVVFSPTAYAAGGRVRAIGYLLKFYLPVTAVAGQTAFLRLGGDWTAPVRLSLYSALPDVATAACWRGAAAGLMATMLLPAATAGDALDIQLAANGVVAAPYLYGVLCLEYAPADATAHIGYPAGAGLNIVDAHVATARLDGAAYVPPEWVGFDGDRTGRLLLPALIGTDATGNADKAAITSHGAAAMGASAALRTSWPDTLTWVTEPIGAVTQVAAKWTTVVDDGLVAVIDSLGLVRLAYSGGDLNAGLATVDGTAAEQVVIGRYTSASTYGLWLRHADGSVSQFRSTAWSAGDPTAWTSIARLTAASDLNLLAGVKADGTVVAACSDAFAGVKTALEALTGVARIVISNTHAVALHTDGTVTVIAFPAASPYADMTAAASWAGVAAVAAAQDAVVAVMTDGSVDACGLTDWLDLAAFDSVAAADVVGSPARRLCVRLDPVS